MKCQICGENEANLHFTTVINGEVTEQHICQACAYNSSDDENKSPFSIHKIFTSLIDSIQDDLDEDKELVCPSCGLKYKEFKQFGKFGCTDCYEAFSVKLDPLFKGIQGDNVHIGKIPKDKIFEISREREINELEAKLKIAINLEEYEKAAVIRDKIKEINIECKEEIKNIDKGENLDD